VALIDEAARRVGWRQRRRQGLEMTALQFLALEYLGVNKRDGIPFCHLPINPRTIRLMVKNDWIFESPGVDGRTLYTITHRGERAHAVFARPDTRRFDGMCTECGEKPKAVSGSGYVYVRCRECLRRENLRNYHERGRQINPDRPCSRCGVRPRQWRATGFIVYCKQCWAEKSREEKRRKEARWRALIQAGDPPQCRKCDQPVHYTARSVYDLCEYHYKTYLKEYRQRQKEKLRAREL
jgi:hypothetical protein